MTENKMKVIFTPGCFDDFEGTQEELDELVAEIRRMAESGELEKNSTPIDIDDILDDDDFDDDDFDDDDFDEDYQNNSRH